MDVGALLVEQLADAVAGAAAGEEMQPGWQDHLPYISVAPLPGVERFTPWNAPTSIDQFDFDIDVFAPDAESAFDTGVAVRAALRAMVIPKVTLLRCPPFTRRPDFNANVRRVGCVISLSARP